MNDAKDQVLSACGDAIQLDRASLTRTLGSFGIKVLTLRYEEDQVRYCGGLECSLDIAAARQAMYAWSDTQVAPRHGMWEFDVYCKDGMSLKFYSFQGPGLLTLAGQRVPVEDRRAAFIVAH